VYVHSFRGSERMGLSFASAAAIIGVSFILILQIFTTSLPPIISDVTEAYDRMKDRGVEQCQTDMNITSIVDVGWWNTSWANRKLIIINHSMIQEDQKDFPVLIYRSADAELAAQAKSNGDDIIFTSGDNSTQYNHEIENYDNTTGELTAWVKIPSLSSTQDTILLMYYGNPSSSNQENITGTWDGNYRMVQHLNESSGTLYDSTSYGNNGTNNGASYNASSKIDGGYDFDGSDSINCGDDPSLDIITAITLEGWVKDPPFFGRSRQRCNVRIVDKRDEHRPIVTGEQFTVQRTITADTATEVVFVALCSPGITLNDMNIDGSSVFAGWYTASMPTSVQEWSIEYLRNKLPDELKELETLVYSKPFTINNDQVVIRMNCKADEQQMVTDGQISYLVFAADDCYDFEGTTHWHYPVLIDWLNPFSVFESIIDFFTDGNDPTVVIADKHDENVQVLPGTQFYVERTFDISPGSRATIVPLLSDSLELKKIEIVYSGNNVLTLDSKVCNVDGIGTEKEFRIDSFRRKLPSYMQELEKFAYSEIFESQGSTTVRFWFKAPSWEEVQSGVKSSSGRISYLVFSDAGDDFDFEGSTWWSSNWFYRKLITVNSSQVDTDLTNFPILVSIADTDLRDKAQGDGDDIAFVLFSDNTTQLNHEIEEFNGTTGKLVAWVNVTSLSSSEDTKIWMYYNNSACSSQQSKEGTWNSNYVIVQHLNETTGIYYDSTTYGNNGTLTDASSGSVRGGAGKVGNAIDFEGDADFINCGQDTSLDVDYITIEAWTKFDVNTGKRVIASIDDGSNRRFAMYLLDETPYKLRFFVFVNNGWKSPDEPFQPTTGIWYHLAGVKNTSHVITYRNGTLFGTPAAHAGVIDKDATDLRIGCGNYPGYFDGIIDEFRMSNVARNSSWILTSYNTMINPNTFIQLGSEQTSLPQVSAPSPTNGSTNIDVPPSNFSISINDLNGDNMNITWKTNESGSWATFNVTNGSGSGVGNGTYSATNTSWVYTFTTKYWWSVNVTDGNGWTNQTYSFTTRSSYTPNPPASFSATANGRFQIDLSWTDHSYADTTRVEWNTSDDPTWNVGDHNLLYNSSTGSTSHTGLDPNTTRYYKAWSFNVTDGIWSSGSTDNATTNSNNPPSYGVPDPANGSIDQPTILTWSISITDTDSDTFNWTIECNNSQSNSANNDNDGTKQLSLSSLSFNTTYTVWVNTTDSYNWTREWYNFTTEEETNAPIIGSESPANDSSGVAVLSQLSVTVDDVNDDLLNATWFSNSSGAWIQFGENLSIDPSSGPVTIRQTNSNFSIHNKTYWWSVNLTDGTGWTNETYHFTTNIIPTQSGEAPVNQSIDIDLSPSLYVICSDLDSDTMTAYWYSNSSSSWLQFAQNNTISSGTNITQINSNFSNTSMTYWWSVNLTDGKDWNNYTYYLTTRAAYTPDAPTSFAASTYGRFQINLTWDDHSYADTTRVEWHTSDDPTWNVGDHNLLYNGSAQSTVHSGLDPSTTRYYKAWSFNITDGLWSSGVTDNNVTDSNNAPTQTGEGPSNSSTGVSLTPQLNVTVDDPNNDTLNATWWSNSTGPWEQFGSNTSIDTSSGAVNIIQTNSNFSNYNTTYWWSVNLSDSYGGWTNETYHFTAIENMNTTITPITPYNQTTSPLNLSATASQGIPDNVTLQYRFSADNSSWRAPGDWFDKNWSYRKKHDIGGTAAGDQTDYTMHLIIHYGSGTDSGKDVYLDSKCKTDFGDIRFTDSDKITELGYYLEEKTDSSNASFWIKIPTINQTTGAEIYIYYGNNTASTTSNGDNAFLLWEDFEEATNIFDTHSTGTVGRDSNNPKEGDYAGIPAAASYNCHWNSTYTYNREEYYIEAWMKWVDTTIPIGLHFQGQNSGTDGYQIIVEGRSADNPEIRRDIYSGDSTKGTYLPTQDVYYFYRGWMTSSTVEARLFDDSYETNQYGGNTSRIDNTYTGAGYVGVFNYNNQEGYVDAWRIRARSSPEPQHSTWDAIENYSDGGWIEWVNSTNPDESSPWNWDFEFPNGTGYYEFYSIGKKSGLSDETVPGSADAICHYQAPNDAPVLSNESPTNGSTGISLNPTLSIQVNDSDEDKMNITWYWGTDSSCPHFIGTNSSVSNGTYYMDNDNNFSSSGQTYYWRVVVNDGNGGWTNETYHFKTIGVNKEIISKEKTAYALEMSQDGKTLYGYVNGTNVTTSIDTQWHYVVLTYDGNTLTIYKDGEQKNSTNLVGSIPTNAIDLILGTNLSGTLDEVRVSNTARSAAWINTSYKMTNSPTTFISVEPEQNQQYTYLSITIKNTGSSFRCICCCDNTNDVKPFRQRR